MSIKIKFGLMLSIFAVFLLACSPTTTPAEPVADESEAVVETEAEVIEEIAEEEAAPEVEEEEAVEEMEEMAEEMAESEEMEEMEEMADAEMVDVAYAVSASDSTVAWRGAKAVGDFHTGVVDITDGSLVVNNGALVSGQFTLDMTTIASTDGAPDRLVQHLNSDDFFGTATFPTAMLVINSAEPLGGDQYAIVGDLTIKGTTNPIEFTATATEADGALTASADIVFDRALYDVRFGSGSFFSDLGDDLINDEVEITVNLVAAHGDTAMESDGEAMADAEEMVDVAYAVSASDSTVAWRGAKAVGDFHTGVVNITDGSLVVNNGALVSGQFTLDMTTIASTDGAPDRLVQHLNSDDFFGTATFPTAMLVINSAEPLGGDQYAIVGDLTIKGTTNPIEFTATATEADGALTASADIVFDRALYDVRFGSGSFFSDLGDDLINDEVEITVNLVAAQ